MNAKGECGSKSVWVCGGEASGVLGVTGCVISGRVGVEASQCGKHERKFLTGCGLADMHVIMRVK